MKNNFTNTVIAMTIALFLSLGAYSQTTEFTYQGSLQNGGSPATGSYDFQFLLFDALTGGTQTGTTLSKDSVSVANGVFSVKLDFGNQFPGPNRFLEIHVRQSGGGVYTPLNPRQPVASAPYAVTSLSATNSINAAFATNASNATNATNATSAFDAANLGGIPASQYITAASGGTTFVQNQNAVFQTGDFAISGTGTANILRAETQFNIGADRVLKVGSSSSGTNFYAGVGAGPAGVSPGLNNSFFGNNSGANDMGGSHNSFFGAGAGRHNSGGHFNAFFGKDAGTTNVDGSSNTFIGGSAGFSTTGNNNTFVGSSAGFGTSTGSFNTFVGVIAGNINDSGNSNTIIGNSANLGTDSLSNATALGANATVSQSNSLVLGNGVNVGIGTSLPQYKLHVVGQNIRVESDSFPRFSINFTGGGVDQTRWQNYATTNTMTFSALNDAENAETAWLQVNRGTGIAISSVQFPNGNVVINNLGAPGTIHLCRNASNQISNCSASAPEPDSVTALQQRQIDTLQKQVNELKALVCSQNPTAAVCKPQN